MKASDNNKDVGGPSTRIFTLNERRYNDTEGTTGPTPKEFVDDIKKTTFPGLNLLLTLLPEYHGKYKTQTESPLDNKTTKKRVGSLNFFNKGHQQESRRLEHRGVNLYDFLRQRGHIWRIKSDHSDNTIATASALTPTGAVTIDKDQRFKPFPGRNTRYHNQRRQSRPNHDANKSDRSKNDGEKNVEHRKQQTAQKNRPNRRVITILPQKKGFHNIYHTTTPVDQLQVIRMMANIIYKPQHNMSRTKQQRNKLVQESNTRMRLKSGSLTFPDDVTDFETTQQTQKTRSSVKEKITEIVEQSERNQFRDSDIPHDTETTSTNDQNRQEEYDFRKTHARTENDNNGRENNFEDHIETRQNNLPEENVWNAGSSEDSVRDTDEVTPPTSFKNQQEQGYGYLNEAEVKEKDDDDVNKSFRNIISRIQLITKAQTRSTEPTTSSPKTTTRMTTTEMTPSSTTTATTTTAKPTTSTTTTTAEYTTTSTTTREITLPTTVALLNNKIKRTMKNNNFGGRYRTNSENNENRKRNNPEPSYTRNRLGPSAQNVRRHLKHDPYINDGSNGNTQTMGTRQVTLFSPHSIKNRPVIRWDGRHSTVADWLKTLRPTYPPPVKRPPSMAVTVYNTSTMVDDKHWKNHPVPPKIYQPNSNDPMYRNRVKFSRNITKSVSVHPKRIKTTQSDIQISNTITVTTVTPYDILMEEEKIATHFSDISISLGKIYCQTICY